MGRTRSPLAQNIHSRAALAIMKVRRTEAITAAMRASSLVKADQ